MVKKKQVSLMLQLLKLKTVYPSLIINSFVRRNTLYCEMFLKPSRESRRYHVRIVLHANYTPNVWMLEPTLERVNGKLPHHIYGFDDNGHPKLCVYHPSEWNGRMYLADSLVPWISTWLNAYEYWLLTGEWFYPAVHLNRK